MNVKMLKEDIRTGQVNHISIQENKWGTCVFVHMRNTGNRFLLVRAYPSAISAVKAIEKMIKCKTVAGLTEEYQRPPYITINYARFPNEKSEHEPQAKP